MLRKLVIITNSGMMLFYKEFFSDQKKDEKPMMLASLLTAMSEFSLRSTGLPLAYIELKSVSITCCQSIRTRLICAIFHDPSDGYEFSQIMAEEVLHSFEKDYGIGIRSVPSVVNLNHYQQFSTKILECIRNAIKAVITNLHDNRAVVLAFLALDDQVMHSTGDFDQLGAIANLQALLTNCSDIMNTRDDVPELFVIESTRGRVYAYIVGVGVLVIVVRKSHDSTSLKELAEHAVSMIKRGFEFISNIQGSSRGASLFIG